MTISNYSQGLTFPAQAVLFAKVVHAFELPSQRARSEGNFFSLMFFIVALGNWLVYANIGYVSNIIAQVSSQLGKSYFCLLIRVDCIPSI
jgi:ATP-binding cassette subfamily B (MDR/TAP) protein 1